MHHNSSISGLVFPCLQQVGEVLDGADHLRNVGVLIVVPGNDLNLSQTAGQLVDHGLGSIEQGAEGHADDVGGDDLVLGVAVGLGAGSNYFRKCCYFWW